MTKLYYNGVERDMTEAEEAQKTIDTNNWNAKKVDVKLQALRDLTDGLDTVEKIANVTYPTKP